MAQCLECVKDLAFESHFVLIDTCLLFCSSTQGEGRPGERGFPGPQGPQGRSGSQVASPRCRHSSMLAKMAPL